MRCFIHIQINKKVSGLRVLCLVQMLTLVTYTAKIDNKLFCFKKIFKSSTTPLKWSIIHCCHLIGSQNNWSVPKKTKDATKIYFF